MLTKDQAKRARDALERELEVPSSVRPATVLFELLAEYEAANPPKPVAVPCSVCGSTATAPTAGYNAYYCSNHKCGVRGPFEDLSAQKWNKLHGLRKLPLDPQWIWVINDKKARKLWNCKDMLALEYKGDPIDVSEWLS